MRRIIAQARKELTQLLRDRLALGLALVLPVALTALMGTTVSLTVTDIPIVIQDLDQTPLSRQYADAFRTSLTFRVVALPVAAQPETMLAAGRARAALIIPEHFERELRRHRPAQTQMLVDATDGNTAKIIRGSAGQVTTAFARQAGGISWDTAPTPAIQTATRLWFNPGRDPRKFYGPGFLVLGLSIFPTVLAALAMSREGEQKTILQVYVSSISAHEFLLGKILAGMVVGVAISFGYAAMPALIVAGVPHHQTGIANGINSISRSVGSAIGSAVITSLLASKTLDNLPAGVPALPAESQFTLSFALAGLAFVLVVGLALVGLATRRTSSSAVTSPAAGTPAAASPAAASPAAASPATGTPAIGTPAIGTPAASGDDETRAGREAVAV